MIEEDLKSQIKYWIDLSIQAFKTGIRDKDYDLRASINRFYYSIFYSASAIILTKGLSSSKHKGVLGYFNKEFVNQNLISKEAKNVYHLLFDMRLESDYKVFYYGIANIELVINDCKRAILEIIQYLKKHEYLDIDIENLDF